MRQTRSARRRSAAVLVVALAAGMTVLLLLAACGSSGGGGASGTPSRAQLTDALRRVNLPSGEVKCAVDHMLAKLSDEELRALVAQAGTGNVSPLVRQDLSDALTPCIPPSATTTTTIPVPAPSP
ncbi:MAG: hypothetical protein ABI276_06395 [Acidimicrobiales bacterium]